MEVCGRLHIFSLFRRFSTLVSRPGGNGGSFTHRRLLDTTTTTTTTHPLYTHAALGLTQYKEQRKDTGRRFGDILESFKCRMKDFVARRDNPLVFTEDFKNVLHLVEGGEEDMALVRDMARRFNKQHEGLRFGMYVFGPVVMRTYHALDQPQEALQALQDPELEGFFGQLISYQVAMDLLLRSGMCKEVLQVFEQLQEKRIAGVKYPKNCLNIAIAACYKLNTQDSLHHLQGLMQAMEGYGIVPNRRLLVFGAALALHTGHPHVALDFLQRSTSFTHITVRSIKVMALCQVGRVDEAVVALRAIAEIDVPGPARSNQGVYILKEAVEAVEKAVQEEGRKDQVVELQRITKFLKDANSISEKSLDEVVCQPIDKFERRPGQERAIIAASFTSPPQHPQRQQGRRGGMRPAPHRPKRLGLMDLE